MDCSRVKDRASNWTQYSCSILLLIFAIAGLLLVLSMKLSGSGVSDARCRCICPHNLNKTDSLNQTIFQKQVNSSYQCDCRKIVPEPDEILCLQCTCKFEMRNYVLIKMIICSMFGVMLLLFAYVIGFGVWRCSKLFTRRTAAPGYDRINPAEMSSVEQFHSDFQVRTARDRRRNYSVNT